MIKIILKVIIIMQTTSNDVDIISKIIIPYVQSG